MTNSTVSDKLESEKQARMKAEGDLYALRKRLGMVSKNDKDATEPATV